MLSNSVLYQRFSALSPFTSFFPSRHLPQYLLTIMSSYCVLFSSRLEVSPVWLQVTRSLPNTRRWINASSARPHGPAATVPRFPHGRKAARPRMFISIVWLARSAARHGTASTLGRFCYRMAAVGDPTGTPYPGPVPGGRMCFPSTPYSTGVGVLPTQGSY